MSSEPRQKDVQGFSPDDQQEVRQDIHGELSYMSSRIRQLEAKLKQQSGLQKPVSMPSETDSVIARLSYSLVSSKATLAGIADIVLNYSKVLTNSAIGYVSSIDLETGNNICHTLTGMIGDSCPIAKNEKGIVFPRDQAALCILH